MQISVVLNQTKFEAFRWRDQASFPLKMAMAGLMAGMVGLLAQVRIPLPYTPVPLTGQTFGVLIAGVLLGKKWGGTSLAIYVGLGIAGIPWFTGATSGLGATAGYLLGFILVSLFVGYFIDRIPNGNFNQMFGLMLFASLVVQYLPGLVWLGIWLNLVKGYPTGIISVVSMGVVPFVAGDILKAGLAAALAVTLLPKKSSPKQIAVDGNIH